MWKQRQTIIIKLPTVTWQFCYQRLNHNGFSKKSTITYWILSFFVFIYLFFKTKASLSIIINFYLFFSFYYYYFLYKPSLFKKSNNSKVFSFKKFINDLLFYFRLFIYLFNLFICNYFTNTFYFITSNHF